MHPNPVLARFAAASGLAVTCRKLPCFEQLRRQRLPWRLTGQHLQDRVCSQTVLGPLGDPSARFLWATWWAVRIGPHCPICLETIRSPRCLISTEAWFPPDLVNSMVQIHYHLAARALLLIYKLPGKYPHSRFPCIRLNQHWLRCKKLSAVSTWGKRSFTFSPI